MIQNQQEASASAHAKAFRDDFLIQTLAEYKFVLPGNAIEWRAKRTRGSIPSLNFNSVTMLATDGVVAYFVLGDDVTLFYGHLAAFEEDKGELEPKPKKEKKLSPRQTILQSI